MIKIFFPYKSGLALEENVIHIETAEYRFCPLIKNACKGPDCMIFTYVGSDEENEGLGLCALTLDGLNSCR